MICQKRHRRAIPGSKAIPGCVAKTSGSLVEMVFVPTVSPSTHPVHEPQVPFQVASFSIRHNIAVCAVVLALSLELLSFGGDDAL